MPKQLYTDLLIDGVEFSFTYLPDSDQPTYLTLRKFSTIPNLILAVLQFLQCLTSGCGSNGSAQMLMRKLWLGNGWNRKECNVTPKVGYPKIVALGRIFKMQTRNSYDKFHHLVAKLGTNTSDSTFKLISARNMF